MNTSPIRLVKWPSGIDIQQTSITDLQQFLHQVLPKQGSVEIQQDRSWKLHDWHSHDVDETIVILDGSLTMFWDGGDRVCESGTQIDLVAGTEHGSRASADGAVYAIIKHHDRNVEPANESESP